VRPLPLLLPVLPLRPQWLLRPQLLVLRYLHLRQRVRQLGR
jgi:hypothetical protein